MLCSFSLQLHARFSISIFHVPERKHLYKWESWIWKQKTWSTYESRSDGSTQLHLPCQWTSDPVWIWWKIELKLSFSKWKWKVFYGKTFSRKKTLHDWRHEFWKATVVELLISLAEVFIAAKSRNIKNATKVELRSWVAAEHSTALSGEKVAVCDFKSFSKLS
jgi:hypothetical protein